MIRHSFCKVLKRHISGPPSVLYTYDALSVAERMDMI